MAGLQRSALALAAPSSYFAIGACFAIGLCLALGLAQPARAQFSAAVGVQSDYRYRGISLSSGLPAAAENWARAGCANPSARHRPIAKQAPIAK